MNETLSSKMDHVPNDQNRVYCYQEKRANELVTSTATKTGVV